MRYRRPSFVAGWAAVALLAMAGFAAFSATSSEDPQVEAAAASIGHTAGAYAGLSFAMLGSDGETAAIAATPQAEPEPEFAPESEIAPESEPAPTESEQTGPGPTSSIPAVASGWLSEVEVRAFVDAYFEPSHVNRAIRIAWCESRFDPNNTDPRTGGVGLFNHLPRYWDSRAANAGFEGAAATDPEASTAAAAWEVYHGAGWEIFTCR